MPEDIKCVCNVCHEKDNNTCITDGLCFTEIHKASGFVTYSCLDREQFLPAVDIPFMCRVNDTECCFTDFCNRNLMPPRPMLNEQKPEPPFGGVEIALISVFCLTLLVLVLVFLFCAWHRKEKRRRCPDLEATFENTLPLMDTLSDLKNCSTSGSGSGCPFLAQRTIARQIKLDVCVGKGRFGDVYRATYFGEDVAVKIFSTRDEKSWCRETEIFQSTLLRHNNILRFLASDRKDVGTWTQLLLITEYHPSGSLFDYLSRFPVNIPTMYKMARSIADGLTHLHTEILGVEAPVAHGPFPQPGKPSVAHRDLKSKNILVKDDHTCAIADFGMAVRFYSDTGTVDISPYSKVGTVRYLAPEVLDNTLNMNQFESFKRVDVYAYGLVLWEIARRCNVDGIYEDYQLPYFDMVPSDPSIEEMRKVVCTAKQRPPFPNRWQSIESLRNISKIMKECWYHNAAARLTALRIKKTLAAIGVQKDMKI